MDKCKVTALIFSSKDNRTCFNPLIIVDARDPIELVKEKALGLYTKRTGEWLDVICMQTHNAGASATIADETDAVVDVLGHEAQLMIVVKEAVDLVSKASSSSEMIAPQLATPISSGSPSLDLDSIRNISKSSSRNTIQSKRIMKKHRKRESKRQKQEKQNSANEKAKMKNLGRLQERHIPDHATKPLANLGKAEFDYGKLVPDAPIDDQSQDDGFHFITKKRKPETSLALDSPKKQKLLSSPSVASPSHTRSAQGSIAIYNHESLGNSIVNTVPFIESDQLDPEPKANILSGRQESLLEQVSPNTSCRLPSPGTEPLDPVVVSQPLADSSSLKPSGDPEERERQSSSSRESSIITLPTNEDVYSEGKPVQSADAMTELRAKSPFEDIISVESSSLHESDVSLLENEDSDLNHAKSANFGSDLLQTEEDIAPSTDEQIVHEILSRNEPIPNTTSETRPREGSISTIEQTDNGYDTTGSADSAESDLADYLSSEDGDVSEHSANGIGRSTPTPVSRLGKTLPVSDSESDARSGTSSMRSGDSPTSLRDSSSSESSEAEEDSDVDRPDTNPRLRAGSELGVASIQDEKTQSPVKSDVAVSKDEPPPPPSASKGMLSSRPGLRSTYRPLSFLHEQSLREIDDSSHSNTLMALDVAGSAADTTAAGITTADTTIADASDDADDSSSDSSSNSSSSSSSNDSESESNVPAEKRAKMVDQAKRKRKRQSQGARALLSLTT